MRELRDDTCAKLGAFIVLWGQLTDDDRDMLKEHAMSLYCAPPILPAPTRTRRKGIRRAGARKGGAR
jgi:hypothetical protein